METEDGSTLATRAISAVSSLSQSFQPRCEASSPAISPAPQPYSRSMVMTRYMVQRSGGTTLPYPDLRFNRHSRTEIVRFRLSGIKGDLHRDTLHHLDIVTGRVLWRKQAGDRATCAGNTLQMTFVFLAGGVHVNGHRLVDAHLPQLGFLEVGGHPYVIKVDDPHQFLPGLHVLAYLNRSVGNNSIHRRNDL